jgi:hypothetical protein
MHMLMPPRFHRLLVDSSQLRRLLAAVCSIPPSPRHRLLDLEGDGGGCRSGRGAAREGSRAAHPERGEEPRKEAEQRIRRGEEPADASGAAEGSGAAERRAEADEWWRMTTSAGGVPIGIRSHARRGRGTWAAWWAGPAHFLLHLSFSFFLFFFFIIYYSRLLFFLNS